MNMSLGHRLRAIALVPCCALVVLAGQSIVEAWRTSSQAEATKQVAQVMDGLATAVHALQRERGLSAGFIGGKGQVFVQELKDQRRATDGAVTLLRGRLDAVLAAGIGAEQDQGR